MLSNLRSFFRPAAPPRSHDDPPPPEEVIEAGGANAFLAQALPFVPPTSFSPGQDGTTQRTRRANEELLHAAERALIPAETAPVLFPVGLVARDGLARLGRGGFAFALEKGDLPTRYHTNPFSLTLGATVARWRDLLVRRAAGAADLGIGFAGAVVPDKLTALAELYPEPIVVPPPLAAALDADIRQQLGLASAAEAVLPLFRADPRLRDLYRRIDPGLSPYGMWRLFQILLGRLGISVGIGVNFAARRLVRPDASDLFFDIPIFEELHETESAVVLRAASGIEAQPAEAGYDGWVVWRNEKAPINQGIMLYGDRMIGLAEEGQCALAWWFATFFREVHVSHKNRYDHGYAMDHHPTSVIFVHTEEGLEGPPLT